MLNNIEKNILIKIIDASNSISSIRLAKMFNISINTVRKEITIINNICETKGFYIDTKISSGYSVVYCDYFQAIDFINAIRTDISRFSYFQADDMNRSYFIIRLLLSSNKCFSLDQLSNLMFCSSSTVLRSMEKINTYLQPFNLTLHNKRNKGFCIIGNEYKKRLALTYQHKIYIHTKTDENYDEFYFSSTFSLYDQYFSTIKRCFINTIQHFPELSFKVDMLPKLYNLVLVNHHRLKYDSLIELDSYVLDLVKSSTFYNISKIFLSSLPEEFSNYTENDIILCAMMIEASCEYNSYKNIKDCKIDFIVTVTNNALELLFSHFEIKHLIDDLCFDNLVSYTYHTYRNSYIDIPVEREIISPTINTGLFTNDICAVFGNSLKKQFKIDISNEAIMECYHIFNRSLYDNESFYKKFNVGIFSMHGIYYSQNFASRILENNKKRINKISILDAKNLNAIDDDIDIIFTDISRSSLESLNKPILSFNYYRNKSDINKLNSFINSEIDKDSLCLFSADSFIKTNTNNINGICSIIVSNLSRKGINIEHGFFIQDIIKREKLVSFERINNIAMITNCDITFERPIFLLICNKKQLSYKNKKIDTFIFYSYGKGKRKDIQLISRLFKAVIYYKEYSINDLYKETYTSFNEFWKGKVNS